MWKGTFEDLKRKKKKNQKFTLPLVIFNNMDPLSLDQLSSLFTLEIKYSTGKLEQHYQASRLPGF
jgi:hypothetical protein